MTWRKMRFSISLFLNLFFLLSSFFHPGQAQSCAVFSETFGSSPQHAWTAGGGEWAFSGGRLEVEGLGETLARAETGFFASDFFQLDVEIELNDTSGRGMIGLYPFTSGDRLFDLGEGNVVDGLATILFSSGNVYLLGWNPVKGEWYQSQSHGTEGEVRSIGIRYSADEIVVRINGLDTPLRATGRFDDGPPALDKLWLIAQGDESTTAFFDNICGSLLPSEPDPSPAMTGGEPLIFPYYQVVDGRFTGFALSNYSSARARLEFRAYGESGEMLDLPANPRVITLGAGRQLAQLGHEIFQVDPAALQQGWVEVTSDNRHLGSFFQVGESGRMDGSVSLTRAERHLYFTRLYEGNHAFRNQRGETFISLVNPNGEEVKIELTLHGTGSDRKITRTLPAKGGLFGTLSEIFARSLRIQKGYLSVQVLEGDGVSGFSLLRFPNSRTWIGLNALPPSRTSRLFSAQLASVPGLFTSVKLVNTGARTRRVTLYAIAEDGGDLADPATITLAGRESFEKNAADIFGWPAGASRVGSLRIEADGPDLVGDVLFGDPSRLRSAAALPLQTRLFTQGIFSQVANGLGLFTGLAFYNPGETSARIQMEVFAEDGTRTGSRTLDLPSGRRISQLLTEYLPQTEGQIRGYVHVTSSRPLVAQQLFGTAQLLSAVPPTMPEESVAGPAGSYIQISDPGDPDIQIQLEEEAVGPLVEGAESPVSGALRISVSRSDFVQGPEFHELSIPLDRPISDPDRLTAKVRLTTGGVLPLSGVYNEPQNSYELALPALADGWVFAVVESDTVQRVAFEKGAPSPQQNRPAGWMTPVDWVTCEFHPIRHTDTVTKAEIKRDYLPPMWEACGALSWAGFRSPKLWITDKWNDTDLDPPGRIVHITESKTAKFSGNWAEQEADYEVNERNEEEMLALGQIYIKPSQLADLNASYGVTLGNIFAHELFHAVQAGYDIRKTAVEIDEKWYAPHKAYAEGTATPLGQTFQNQDGSITGPGIDVRNIRDGQYAWLDEPIDLYVANYYRKQDFWAWVAREYGNNSWVFTDLVFEQISLATYRKFDLNLNQYYALYRKGTDQAFQILFGKGYSEIYEEFALDRAYEHSENALFRPKEIAKWKKNKLAGDLFRSYGAKEIKPSSDEADERKAVFSPVQSLSTYVASMEVSETDREVGSITLNFQVTGVELKKGGISIYAFREDEDGVMRPRGRLQIEEVEEPVEIPVDDETHHLKILIINSDLQVRDASVTISLNRKYELNFYQSTQDDTHKVYGTRFDASAASCIDAEFRVYDADLDMPEGVYILFYYPNNELMFEYDWEDLYPPEDGRFLQNGKVWEIGYGICFFGAEGDNWEGEPKGTYRVEVHDPAHTPLIQGTFELY